MEHLDCPDAHVWDERRLWFEERETAHARGGAPAPSEQACALMLDLQAVFCAGAWSAAVILAATIVESQARATGGRGDDVPGLDAETWRWLRALRNRLVHEDPGNPALTIDHQWQRRAEWKQNARRAIEAAFAALYPRVRQP